jgi:hypothetical protein
MIDLHVHSIFSDGSLSPEEIIQEADRIGLTAVALTDHDSTAGVPRFLKAAAATQVEPIAGVEISAEFRPGTMHILGYCIAPEDADLSVHLKWIREGREARNHEILSKLIALNCHLSWEEVASYAGDDVVGRPHFAQALVKHGYAADKNDAFKRFLGRGRPAYADRRRLSPENSIQLIHDAGGLAVLAHPFTLGLNRVELRRQVRKMVDCGLDGIEVYYSEHSVERQQEYLKLVKDYGLVATGGTDYHGDVSPDISLGKGFGNLRVPDDVLSSLKDRHRRCFPLT